MDMNRKPRIAIVAGGFTSEHDVSLRSAAGIESFLDKEKYDVEIVQMDGIGEKDVNYKALDRLREFDYAYITIHGAPGENGLLQGYLDMIGVPYSCCGVLPAAMTFNKYTCNHYLAGFGIPIAKSILIRKNEWTNGRMANGEWANVEERIVGELGLPCFIKSNVGGSSFGCTKVKTKKQVVPAIETAFGEGNEVICEAFMKGVEVTCGVYKTKNKEVAFPLTEVVTENEFFDYDAKYNGQVDEITPARIPDEVRDEIQALTLRIYDILGCHGIIRVDYILTEGWKVNLLEVNTTPGMTATSFIPQQVRAAGLNITDVLGEIIDESLR